MNHTHLSIRSFIGWRQSAAIVAAAALGLSTMPVSAQTVGSDTFGCVTPPEDTVHLEVSNPGPGDRVPFGTVIIHGVAYDRSATTPNSIDRVSLFLGTRGSGGTHLADATLGLPNPHAAPGSLLDTAGWDAAVTLPNTAGPAALAVYAHSGVTDHESTVWVPFNLGQDSTSAQCTTSTTGGTSGPTSADTIHLELSNPSPGGSIFDGNMVVQGIAYDTEATEGPGVDRVTLFLDNRDQGGIFLGAAVPQTTASAWSESTAFTGRQFRCRTKLAGTRCGSTLTRRLPGTIRQSICRLP